MTKILIALVSPIIALICALIAWGYHQNGRITRVEAREESTNKWMESVDSRLKDMDQRWERRLERIEDKIDRQRPRK